MYSAYHLRRGFVRDAASDRIYHEIVAHLCTFHYFATTAMIKPQCLIPIFVFALASAATDLAAQSPVIVSDAAFTTRWFLNLFSVMALAVVGLYNCVIFIMRSKDRAPLYFGAFCIFIAINTFVSFTGVSFLTDLFPNAAGLPLHKIDIITIILSIPLFVMFTHTFYHNFINVLFQRLLQVTSIVFIVIAVVLSGKALDWVFSCYFPVILVSIIYSVIIGIRALLNKQHDSHGVLAGIIVMSIAGINDVLWGYGVTNTIIIMPYATLVFALIYSVLISRRFANALISAERLNIELIENQRLRAEMQQRVTAEQELRQAQRRLTALLHSVDSPLCATNSAGTIVFCNRAFEELSGQSLEKLIYKEPPQLEKPGILSTDIPLELEDEQLSVHLYGSYEGGIAPNRSVVTFVEELNRNRARIRSLEELLTGSNSEKVQSNLNFRHDLEMIDTALQEMGTLLEHDEDADKKKRLGIEVLKFAISYWSDCTKTSKFELAEESGLWKVQMNPDGWKRTQTLDRYLDYKTFPQNPRWNQIVKTADFVLIRCQTPSETRNQLELVLQKLCMLTEFSR
ncbi:MAG TPA: 7TM diverse intracellular signaling domain-containing protein [Chitinispirillaceae bacterium]|nr:7TM diverse intracellular signaling domain-containing protein [Chitinispirillaceae bacterium]